MGNRLLGRKETSCVNELTDELYAFAYNVETALQDAGATTEDYTVLDLFKLAQPFAVERFKESKSMKYDRPFDKVLEDPYFTE